jgi:hypothetical protein
VTVGSLLRREGRAAHSQDRPVVPRARDVVADRGPAHRAAVTAGTVLAVAAVLGTNVVGEVAFGPGTTDDDGERGFGGAVAPEGPNPLSLTATGAPIGNAMAVLRAAGSPVLAAVNDLAGGPPASGAGIVARALAGLPGSPAVAFAPAGTSTAASSEDRDVAGDEDDATADTSDGARSSTSSTRASTRSDSTDADETRSSTRRSSDRVTPTPRRGGGSDDAGTGSAPVRIPPVLSGRGTSGPSPSGGATDAPPTTPVVPAPATTPDSAPDGGTGSTPGTKTEDDGDTGGGSPTSEIPTTDSATPDSLKTGSSDESGTDDGDRDAPSTTDGSSSEEATSGDDTSDDAKSDSPTSDSSDSSDGSDSSDDAATDSSSS